MNKTLLREHYMKMKKLLSELLTLLKYGHATTGEKYCCEPTKSCGHYLRIRLCHKKSAQKGTLNNIKFLNS